MKQPSKFKKSFDDKKGLSKRPISRLPMPPAQLDVNASKALMGKAPDATLKAQLNANAAKFPAGKPIPNVTSMPVPTDTSATSVYSEKPSTAQTALNNAQNVAVNKPINPVGQQSPIGQMPQANKLQEAQMTSMQKMPQPNTVSPAMKRGGKVRGKTEAKFSSGGPASKASSRGDGIAQRGKTKGRYI